jgi:hypothetical protein
MALKPWTPQLIQDSGGDKIVVSKRPEQKKRNSDMEITIKIPIADLSMFSV